MATADSDTVISCPSCGARFAVPVRWPGERRRCDACNEAFYRAGVAGERSPGCRAGETAKPVASVPDLIGVECRVCGTRLYGRSDQVGKKVKCPDCGAGTVLPRPPQPKPKNMPAALEGEQYELWDADEQPLPSELIAVQPKYIAVTCRMCGIADARRGEPGGPTNRLPGLRHETRGAAAAASRWCSRPCWRPIAKRRSWIRAAAPGERPLSFRQLAGCIDEERQEAEYAARTRKIAAHRQAHGDRRARPTDLPRWPLLSGDRCRFCFPPACRRLGLVFPPDFVCRWIGYS